MNNGTNKRLSGGLPEGPVTDLNPAWGRKASKCPGMIALGRVFIMENHGCQIGESWALGLTLGKRAGDPWPGPTIDEKLYDKLNQHRIGQLWKHSKHTNGKQTTFYHNLHPFTINCIGILKTV